MSNVTLEERMMKLEQIVDKFIHKSDVSTPKKDWHRTVGMFDGDPIMKEIIEEGQRIREGD